MEGIAFHTPEQLITGKDGGYFRSFHQKTDDRPAIILSSNN
jgi:hypothetical protein